MDAVLGSASPAQSRQGRGTPALRRNGGVADNPEKRPGRRKACNECKQQKLRCEFGSGSDATSREVCNRCNKLGLDCRVEDGFRRTRKRRRSVDLEDEIRELRKQLETRNGAPDQQKQGLSSIDRWFGFGLCCGVSHCRKQHLCSPLPRPRALGNIVLSVDEIDELFNIYVTYYHPFLPLIDTSKSPHEYYQLSELLFWSIISVSSRRVTSRPTLLPKLARNVTDLLWKTLRSIPHSLMTVQGLALLCSWPFPTNSSTADPTFMLVGTMLQIATQMGLHRALDAQDFAKVPTKLDALEHAEWVRTWDACNIVAQSVSVGCGLPLYIQTYDWSLSAKSEPEAPELLPFGVSFRHRLRIEKFRLRVSSSLGSHVPEAGPHAVLRERLTIYWLLNSELAELESEEPGDSAFSTWFLAAARLHLHAFYLFDDAVTDGYNDRILTLYSTAYSLIELSLEYDSQETGFLDYCPFFCYQMFVCVAFVILKILMNGFFRSILDNDLGMKLLEAAIAALRKISVVNNDLPARLGDVIGFFCALKDPTVIGGAGIKDLRLRQVKNRLRPAGYVLAGT
ncbi:hypothetical protein VUR80DRAFT_6038 [Thermomyces stellatus]